MKKVIFLSEAREKGLPLYFTGCPCSYGHVSKRRVSTRGCLECEYRDEVGKEAKRLYDAKRREEYGAIFNARRRAKYAVAHPIAIATEDELLQRRRIKRLAASLRNCILETLKGRQKSGSAVSDLGCSIGEFKSYIEKLFQPGMTWENWSVKGWHLDHKVPLAFFDLTKRDQFLMACNYKNYQPLWAIDHYRKTAVDVWLIKFKRADLQCA